MKRLSNVYDKIISKENLLLAHKNACKGKSHQKGVITFKKNLVANIEALHQKLKAEEYITPIYKVFTIHEPKEREIYVLPYIDRVVQHAILQVIGDMFRKNFTKDTYSCIPKRGVHLAKRNLQKALLDKKATEYCLKIDIVKFYPSINHDILKAMLRRKIKDDKLLRLLDCVIESTSGVAIGNFLSQYFGNFYLSPFDHWLKEQMNVKHMFRYCDDTVILSHSKEFLHHLLIEIKKYLWNNLRLTVKGNHQVFPVAIRGIDFLGYKTYNHRYSRLRKMIKKRCYKMIRYNYNEQSMASYGSWLKWGNCINLKRKLNEQISLNGYDLKEDSRRLQQTT